MTSAPRSNHRVLQYQPARVWRKSILPADELEWFRRLSFVDPTRIVISGKPGAAWLRLEVYHPTTAELKRLHRDWGGGTVRIPVKAWLLRPRQTPILRAGSHRRIAVFNDAKARRRWNREHPLEQTLLIPAGLAFGSGDHATTAMAARRLARAQLAGRRVLDIGTGSGILALAARALGAAGIDAFDFDPLAIRVARENERLNFPSPTVRWSVDDILSWKGARRYDLVAANLFSELLIKAARPLWRATAPGGTLLLTGILKTQEDEVRAAFWRVCRVKPVADRRGKWVLLCFEKR